MNVVRKERRLTKSQVNSFHVTLCIFCQERNKEQLQSAMQDYMDIELKVAFEECTNGLERFRIRWEGTFDARAREIKGEQTKIWK